MDINNVTIADDMIKVCQKAQQKARMLNRELISDILILNELVLEQNSYLALFLRDYGISNKKACKVARKLVKEWAKNERENSKLFPRIRGDTIFGFDTIVLNIFLIGYQNFAFLDIDELCFWLTVLKKGASKYLISFFEKLNISFNLLERYFEGVEEEIKLKNIYQKKEKKTESNLQITIESQNNESKENKVGNFLTEVRAEEEESPIKERENETMRLMQILLKHQKSNALIVGRNGVGKKALVEHLVWCIKNNRVTEKLRGKKIMTLDICAMIEGTTSSITLYKRKESIKNFLSESDNLILFINDIHKVFCKGETLKEHLELENLLKFILSREKIQVIATTNEFGYEILKEESDFRSKFDRIQLKEPRYQEVYPMIKAQIERLKRYHNVEITKDYIYYAIQVASCIYSEIAEPQRSINFIDTVLSNASIMHKKEVNKEVILSTLAINFKRYNELTKEQKMQCAYHEAGHYIVGQFGENNCEHVIAVSIIPGENCLGITYFEIKKVKDSDYSTLIHDIAIQLAGRIAEKMYSGQENASASDDIEGATRFAERIVMRAGFSQTTFRRNVENIEQSEKQKIIGKAVDNILEEAAQYAEKILKEKRALLDKIAHELFKNSILVQNDLKAICRQYEEEKHKKTKTDA